MDSTLPVYNEMDLRSYTNDTNLICAIDEQVYDLSVLKELMPSLQGA